MPSMPKPRKDKVPRSKSLVIPRRQTSYSASEPTLPPPASGAALNGRVSFSVGGESTPPPPPTPTAATPPAATTEALGPVCCPHNDHPGFNAVDDIIDLPVDKVFEAIFTQSVMYDKFCTTRKMTDMVCPPWPSEQDENGCKVKTLTYVLALNYTVGPKSSKTIEKQTWRCFESAPGSHYVVDNECVTPDVPYGNSFYLLSRFCITRVSDTQTRLFVNSELKYKQKVFGFMKSIIEKSVVHGTTTSYSILAEHLHDEAARQAAGGVTPPPAGGGTAPPATANGVVMRRKTGGGAGREKRASRSSSQSSGSASDTNGKKGATEDASAFSTFIFISLVVLVFVNVFLYYQLRSLEGRADQLYIRASAPGADWREALRTQDVLHGEEMKRWREVLNLSSQVLVQMKERIDDLQQTIDQRIHFSPDKT